ncbi:ribose-phosphate pyrophosphokinase [Sphingomonas sp.]|uniref:ribose-phosphate pyrophosphokinase n=1 Tax=Sphingomonas sp. TaxID=28214 RepID=UPI0025D8780A|nr:ribose-phosphate pyrophosphokinase [Sphingomonas sp.]
MTGACHPGRAMIDQSSANSIADVVRVRALLIGAAKAGEAISYSHLLAKLGHRFTRPKMRALCKTLDVIDEAAIAAGEPELAVLVVRESDGLPGQGWWGGARAFVLGYDGPWTGPRAMKLVREQQQIAFDYWRGRMP